MKSFKMLLSLSAFVMMGLQAQAAKFSFSDVASKAVASQLTAAFVLSEVSALEWKEGDYQVWDIDHPQMPGQVLTLSKAVVKDVPEKNAFWFETILSLGDQKQINKVLVSRVDGSILESSAAQSDNPQFKVLADEEDQGTSEVVEQNQTKVTVPAGTFDAIYMKIKNTTAAGVVRLTEIWVNPYQINLDGGIKMTDEMPAGKMTMQLRKFGTK